MQKLTRKQVSAIVTILAAVLSMFGYKMTQGEQDAAEEVTCIATNCEDGE